MESYVTCVGTVWRWVSGFMGKDFIMSITITQIRNAVSMNAANTSIDVEINHPEFGWIPYLLTDYDTDTTINNDEVMALIGTDFAAYVAPTSEELAATISWPTKPE